ncbi:hypothetical protein EGK59_01355 [Acinetobacter soli]|uniref:hypothetical protein n=1 Tax=Acinetobacter soli TaxID=487316 RepID=UPI000F667C84|nr:hypothetical protein [Acinetobacter soli]RSB58159.1 hypothetical protein EGK59_01355 [Acinetobacter soli]
MGLFDEKQKSITENYVKVLDVLEKLYEKSDHGWFEVLHFLKDSSIDSITTYSCTGGIPPEVVICDKIPIEKVYKDEYGEGELKYALCAFIANNCDSLDGEHLENRIIAENEMTQQFKQYAWLKSDIQNLDEFCALNLIELIELGRPLKNNKKITNISEVIYQENRKYEELIWCIQGFSERFNKSIQSIAKFLKQKKFYKHCDTYIRIGIGDFVKLNKVQSEKSISFILDFLDNPKFNTKDFGYDVDYYEFNHILIDSEDLYYFDPLSDLIVDLKIGHDIYENVRYGDIKLNKLPTIEEFYHQESGKRFSEHWERLKSIQIEQELGVEPDKTNINLHPSLDPNHPNHAPELLLAIKAWEAKYLENEYPYQGHTPAITQILKNKDITQTNLVKRICAITNPRK